VISKFLKGEERMEGEGFGACSGGARPMEADSGTVGMIAKMRTGYGMFRI
jgi:hypothetical protein